jgi:hypothetical protein
LEYSKQIYWAFVYKGDFFLRIYTRIEELALAINNNFFFSEKRKNIYPAVYLVTILHGMNGTGRTTPLTKHRIKSPRNHGSRRPKAGRASPAARKIWTTLAVTG